MITSLSTRASQAHMFWDALGLPPEQHTAIVFY